MSIRLSVDRLVKSYPREGRELPVLDGISLEGKPGQIISVLGKSGCGKSTLLNIISGVEAPTQGTVQVLGRVGYMPQHDTLLPWRNVLENVLLPAEVEGTPLGPVAEQARNLLHASQLEQFIFDYPAALSGGMRQRVSLIRTFLQEADIVLFDEPFSAIDYSARLQLGAEVRKYIVDNRRIGVFVTHNIEEAIGLGDRLVVLGHRPARIVLDKPITLSEDFRDPVTMRKNEQFQDLFAAAWKELAV